MSEPKDDKALVVKDLAIKAVKAVGPGGEEPENPQEAFFSACRSFLRSWQLTHPESARHKQSPVLFLFSENQPAPAVLPEAIGKPSFRNLRPPAIGGNVYVCNGNLREMLQFAAGFSDETAPLQFLADRNLEHCSAIVFLPAQDAVLLHESNADLNDAVRYELGAVSKHPFQFSHLDSHLTNFYRRFVESHHGACDIWAVAGDRKLKPRPEQQIQRNLVVFLEFIVGTQGAKVDQEILTTWGRSDVRVLAYSSPTEFKEAIMELKVLGVGSQDPKAWALSGVQQLVDYRQGKEAQTADCYLCCYDARKEDKDIPEVVATAIKESVIHRRYFMKTPGYGMRGG
jgi:hypothetical protein